MKRRLVIGAVLVATIFALSCSHEPSPEETTVTSVGQMAPTFSLTTLDGHEFNLEQLRGKVVLVNFWATWCPPCREEIPHLETKVWHTFKDRDFTMIAISREEETTTVRAFVEANDMSFPVGVDSDRSIYSLYAESFIPRNVLVAADGTILLQSWGYDEAEFAHMVETIAQELPDDQP